MTITTQPLQRLFFITWSHSSNQTAVYQINHHSDSTPERHYNLLLENLSKVKSHDSLTHLNNNALTQPLKLSEIFFRKYKIQSMQRISLICSSLFHFNTKIDPETKISHKEQKVQQPDIFCPRCWCHVLHCPSCTKLHPISSEQTEIFQLFARIFSISMLCSNSWLSVDNSLQVGGSISYHATCYNRSFHQVFTCPSSNIRL